MMKKRRSRNLGMSDVYLSISDRFELKRLIRPEIEGFGGYAEKSEEKEIYKENWFFVDD